MLLLAMQPPLSIGAQGIESIVEGLDRLAGYSANVAYQVTMPAFSELVDYTITLTQQPTTPSDTLAPRDCGVSDTPVTVIVDTGGMVREVITGFNNSLPSDVTQKTALLK